MFLAQLRKLIGVFLIIATVQTVFAQEYGLDFTSTRLCIIQDQLPFQSLNDNLAIGIVAEFNQEISEQAALNYMVVEADNEQVAIQMLASGQCDAMYSLINENHQQAPFIYSKTINNYPLAMAILSSSKIDIEASSYKEQNVAIGSKQILNNISFFDSAIEMTDEIGVTSVATGLIDGYINVMPTLVKQLQKNPKSNIKIIELTLEPLALKLVMRANDHALMSKVNNIIETISEQTITDIETKWLSLNYHFIPRTTAPLWLLVFIPIVLLIFFKLKMDKIAMQKNVQQLTLENETLNHSLDDIKQQQNLGLRFVEIISHEYRTPVSVISTNADILELKNEQGNLGLSGQISKIRDAVTRLIAIVETTLDREKLSSESMIANMEMFDFTLCLNDVLNDLARVYLNRTVSIKCIPDDVMPFLGDQRLISLMLRNLVENTFKYSPTTSPVEITLRLDTNTLQLTIRDYGIGIPNTEIEHIFEKYHRARNTANTQGIGVGLYLSKSIVIQHHGEISVRCPDNDGTEVLIVLPITNPQD